MSGTRWAWLPQELRDDALDVLRAEMAACEQAAGVAIADEQTLADAQDGVREKGWPGVVLTQLVRDERAKARWHALRAQALGAAIDALGGSDEPT